MRTIAIVNQKGGCGKTTSAINLASVFARRGHRTLLVDIDPQSHCAAGLGVPEKCVEYSIADAMVDDLADDFDPGSLVWEVGRNLDLAPSTMRLAALEAPGGGLHELPDRDRRLERVLERLAPRYDCCLIDCPPTIGLLTFNALRATRETLIPVETGYFALKGAQKQWDTVQRVIQHIGRPIACHILPTLYNGDTALARDVLAALRRQFAGQILPLVINEHQELREAASMGQAVVEYAPDSAARRDYEALADWLSEHELRPIVEISIGDAGAHADLGARRPGVREEHPPVVAVDSTGVGGRAGELAGRLRRALLEERGRSTTEPAIPAWETAPMLGTLTTVATEPAPPPEAPPPPDTDAPLPEPRQAPQEAPQEAPQSAPETLDVAPDRVEPFGPAPAPSAAPSGTPVASIDIEIKTPAALVTAPDRIGTATPSEPQHLYGVRATSRGMLFVQPSAGEHTIYLAGDFNNWVPNTTPLRRNADLGVAEALVRISPGRHQYRLVVDGRWTPDPYNDQHVVNDHDELNSVVIVPQPPAE